MSLITVQSGPRNARTDSETGLRWYTWQGVEYPSVTSIRNLAGMPFKLNVWRTNQVIERAMTQYPQLGKMLGESDPKAVASWLRKAADEKRDAAANLGTRVHDAAAESKTLDQVGPDVAPYLLQYRRWIAESGIRIDLVEQQVWNKTVGYAGTFDLIGMFPKTGTYWLIDIKTGTGTYPEHALQVEAYRQGEFIGEDDQVDDGASAILRQVVGSAILHLQPDGWSFKAIKESSRESTWRSFRGLHAFAMWAHEFQTIDGLIANSANGGKP